MQKIERYRTRPCRLISINLLIYGPIRCNRWETLLDQHCHNLLNSIDPGTCDHRFISTSRIPVSPAQTEETCQGVDFPFALIHCIVYCRRDLDIGWRALQGKIAFGWRLERITIWLVCDVSGLKIDETTKQGTQLGIVRKQWEIWDELMR
jgi:hypothetical protein